MLIEECYENVMSIAGFEREVKKMHLQSIYNIYMNYAQ